MTNGLCCAGLPRRNIVPRLWAISFSSSSHGPSSGSSSGTSSGNSSGNSHKKPKWIPVGLGAGLLALALTEYRHIKQRQEEEPQRDIIIQGPLWLHLYTRLPLRYLSQLWGYVNNELVVPRWARKPLFGLYSWAFNCQLNEAVEENLENYENLGKFFYRALKPGMRPLASTELVLIVMS